MRNKEEMRSGSKWRRSLMALAILSAPVISIGGFSGNASAGSPSFDANHYAEADCEGDGGAGISVTIVKDANGARYSVTISGTVAGSNLNPPNGGQETYHYPKSDGTYSVRIDRTDGSNSDSWSGSVTVSCDAEPEDDFSAVPACEGGVPGITVTVPNVKPGNGPRNDIFVDGIEVETAVADGTPVFIPLIAGTYDISVEVSGTAVGSTQEVTISAYICLGDPEDGTVSEVCSGEDSPGLNINIPNEKPGDGPKYTIYISADGEDVDYDYDEVARSGDGFDADFNTGEGEFHIVIIGADKEDLYNDYFTVDCSNGGGGDDGWNININFTKPKALPTTGSDTDTLLIIAPMMVLLGAGLIMARRRLAAV